MKRKIIVLLTVFTLVCLNACSSNEQASASDNNSENSVVAPSKEPEATTEPSSETEPIVELTSKATEESAPEPTEEPVLYEGIDMESDLPGKVWIKTFIGVIDEPKIVVFSDETGRKEIIEEGATVTINPDEDAIALYIPEGYKSAYKIKGISETIVIVGEHYEAYYLDPEKTREKKFKNAAFYVDHGDEEIALKFIIQSE